MERLNSLEQARRQLLSNLVHELGRSLGALRSAISALLGRSGEDAALRQELLVGMDEEVDRLRRLLDDLAGHHDHVLGTLELDLRPTELSEWLTHMQVPGEKLPRPRVWAGEQQSLLICLRWKWILIGWLRLWAT